MKKSSLAVSPAAAWPPYEVSGLVIDRLAGLFALRKELDCFLLRGFSFFDPGLASTMTVSVRCKCVRLREIESAVAN